jgi:hypothetical protein
MGTYIHTENDSINYHGKVTLIKRDKFNNITYHNIKPNGGTTYLFDFLINCLGGAFNKLNIPNKLAHTETNLESLSNSFVELNSTTFCTSIDTKIDGTNHRVIYSFTLTNNHVKNSTLGQGSHLLLLSNSAQLTSDGVQYKDVFAYFSIENDIKLEDGDVLYITWSLSFTNPTELPKAD